MRYLSKRLLALKVPKNSNFHHESLYHLNVHVLKVWKIQNCALKLLRIHSCQLIRLDSCLDLFFPDEQVALVNFELDVPPGLEYLPHRIPVQIIDKEIMAEAQFLAQQRNYWPSGFL